MHKSLTGLFLSVTFIAAAFTAPAAAQPYAMDDTLRIVRIETDNFPIVRVYLRVFCGGRQYQALTYVDVEVEDSGITGTWTLNCPPETVPFSVALVLDRSGSVAGTSIYRIQEGAWRFVELMQEHGNSRDEAAIISFSSDVTVNQSMTSTHSLLFSAIQQLYPWGNTAMWDAVMFGIYEAASGSNPIKAVVVLSDGIDNVSASDLRNVIPYARQEGIPIFTLCLMYHADSLSVKMMKMAADSTGGMFIPLYHPDDIVPAFNAIASLVTGGANDCVLQYRVDCPDGSLRSVKVTARACGKTVTASAQYRAPLDPNLPSVNLVFDTAQAYERGDLYIPVLISASGSDADITDLRFKVLRQDSVDFVRAITDGHFARHLSLSTWQVSDTLHFHLQGNARLSGYDTLMILHFRTRSFAKDTTLPLFLFYLEKNTVQCLLLKVTVRDHTVRKRPSLAIACRDSMTVRWDRLNAAYLPSELEFSTTVSNIGSVQARNTRAWITLPYGIRLVSGPDTVALLNNFMNPSAGETVRFRAVVLPTDTAREYTVCITVQADSGLPVVCCTRLTVEKAAPALRCSISMPSEVRWSDSAGSYVPPVFPVKMTVHNVSAITARAVDVWLDPPEGFDVAPSPPLRTTLVPSDLATLETGSVTWMVTPRDRMYSDSVTICIRAAAGGDTALCCDRLFVSSAPVRAAVICANARALVYDEEKGAYDPPQFLASVTIRNISGIDMAQTRGMISLPSFLSLAPGENPTKVAPGGAVVQPGDSVVLTWALVASGPPKEGAQVCIDVLAGNYPGGRCCFPVLVQTNAAIPLLRCSLAGPDTVRYLDSGYDPNPAVLDMLVENIGTSPAKAVTAALLQGADLSIDSTDQALKTVSDSLAVAASARTQFRIRILDRGVSRFDTIRVTVYAANGGATVCEKIIWIEGVRGPLLELQCAAPEFLEFSDSSNSYRPNPFIFSITATNVGTAPADSVVAEFLPPPDVTLAQGENPAKLLTPSTLGIGRSGTASWQIVALPSAVARTDTLRAQVRSKGRVLAVTQPCIAAVRIPPVRNASLELACSPETELSVVGDAYVPDPFTVRLLLRNNGDADAFDISASVFSQGRLQTATGDSIMKIRPLLRANGGQTELLWYFTARPQAQGDSAEVCIRVSARYSPELICCTKIWLPPLGSAAFNISCEGPDTIRFDTAAGAYPNPFLVSATVSNPTTLPVDSVRITLLLPAGLAPAAGETTDRRILNLAPGRSEKVQWLLDVIRDTSTVAKSRRIRIQFYGGEMKSCDLDIIVLPPPPGNDTTAFALSCSSPDSIRFINAQIGLQPSPFTVSAEIANTGTTTLDGVQATLVLPPGITLTSGENPTKALGSPLQPAKSATISWSCVPALSDETATVSFIIRLDATGAASAFCETPTVVERVFRIIELAIPKGNVVRQGRSIAIPVIFTNTTQALVNFFQFDVLYDPVTVHIDRVTNANTLTVAWPPLTLSPQNPGRIRIAGASGDPLSGSGPVAYLNLLALSGDGTGNSFGWKLSDLTLADPVVPEGVRVELQHGDVVTSGDCLVPLSAGERFALQPNRPNPFRDATTISFSVLPDDAGSRVSVDVYDAFGRHVRRLTDAVYPEGEHSLRFDASGLPEGVYFCRLTAAGGGEVRMLLKSR